jgi:hypothetical protein
MVYDETVKVVSLGGMVEDTGGPAEQNMWQVCKQTNQETVN